MKLSDLPIRKCDSHGCGHFGASRGSRKHNGIDLLCANDITIQSPIDGEVTKIGWPYAGADYRYVQVTNNGYDFRFFYIEPSVKVGDRINKDYPIGEVQNLKLRYDGIQNHIHFEIMKDGEYIDPTPVIIAIKSV